MICFTIGEKGIRWESGAIPVAVSPILAKSYNRNSRSKWGWMLDALFATDLWDWEGATTDKSEDLPLHYWLITCWNTGDNRTFILLYLLIERLVHNALWHCCTLLYGIDGVDMSGLLITRLLCYTLLLMRFGNSHTACLGHTVKGKQQYQVKNLLYI